ncbi:nucleotidyltransferase family protein [Terriglobus sp.]|uniref:nucleotidyltransferase family protein n=1 Tax=Terriglobus sp. TaxID=1889013 RepID=UPI003B00AD8B
MTDGRRHLGAVILAAGASTRLGQPKQLLQFGGETLVERMVRIAHEAGAQTVFAVLGANYQPIFRVLQPYQPELRVLLNQRWAEGMGTSIALAAAAAERHNVDDLLVLTCDQVAVTPGHLRELVAASHREHVVASTYSSRRGVPALFPEFSFHALQHLSGDRGARDLLQHDDVLQLPLPGGEIDIDTPGDLAQLSVEAPSPQRGGATIKP